MPDKKSDKKSEKPEKILPRVNSPADLHALSADELSGLAEELRELIIQTVSVRGGHLASNLGVTELTVALHLVFDFQKDRLLWDVGHQCYAHKILTGRRDRFDTLRQAGGLSGFPNPTESSYDLFHCGHAGTAMSTAAGMAWADQLAGRNDRKVVAIVGDASIVNGLALEGINNAGLLKRQFLVILNDNSMAIDVTQGALARALDRLRLTRTYTDLKSTADKVVRKLPMGGNVSTALKQMRDGLRTSLHGQHLFEAFGFRYFGPVDGHDIPELLRMLRLAAEVNEPVLLHVHTQKGHGCDYAVEDPCLFHSPSAHRVNGGVVEFPKRPRPSWTSAFSSVLVEAAKKDDRIVAITAAMPDGTGLVAFRDQFPDRYIDVGINESHAVAMAAGLARSGLRPVVAVYSTFLQRAFDQAFEEVSLQKLPVIFCMDRAGLCGNDGPVHHGFLDIAFLRPLPGLTLMAPCDEAELRSAMDLALSLDTASAIRYPRDEVSSTLAGPHSTPFELGKAAKLREGDDATFLAFGAMVEHALSAATVLSLEHGIDVAVYSGRFAKPLDEALIAQLIQTGRPVVCVEDHAAIGGFGSAVLEAASRMGLDSSNVRVLGLPDRFIAHASRSEQLKEAGLDALSLARSMLSIVQAQAARKM